MTLQDIIMQLSGQAKPRPDLMPGGEKPYTYAGRVGTGPMKLSDMMARQPVESPDAEGLGGGAALAMAKVFKPGPSLAARMAKKGSQPVTEFEKMFPALIDEASGEVIHGMKAVGAGGHKPLYEAAGGMKNFKPTRGFLDPATFDAYTEAMLEEILLKAR